MNKKHIVVSEETKQRFEDMKNEKGMTQDGLIRYWLRKEESSSQEFHK
jgi:hypothetical protein